MRLRAIVGGALNWVGLRRDKAPTEGGATQSARYCYTTWLRHLVSAHDRGLSGVPRNVGELGPGASVGAGLAALLSGAERYYALDITPHATLASNLRVFDELVALFQLRAPIPDNTEFPKAKPLLSSQAFPEFLVSGLSASLAPERLDRIRESLRNPGHVDSLIRYAAPWQGSFVRDGSLDFVFSQAVLEHIDDLDGTYRSLSRMLRAGGWMSHQIDFKSHSLSRTWDGHWAYPGPLWRIARGRRLFFLNREPVSTHTELIARDLQIVATVATETEPALPRRRLARRFRSLPDQDLRTSGALIQAVRPPLSRPIEAQLTTEASPSL